jgi:hypothetical protein
MSDEAFMIAMPVGLSLVAGLCLFLAIRIFLRQRRQKHFSRWNGAVFHSAPIAPRLSEVRQDYVTALHSRPRPLLHPQKFVESARESITRLGYFRSKMGSEPNPDPDWVSP